MDLDYRALAAGLLSAAVMTFAAHAHSAAAPGAGPCPNDEEHAAQDARACPAGDAATR
jgi:hypothetical protein